MPPSVRLLLFTIFLSSIDCRAFVPSEMTTKPCATQIEKILKKYRSEDKWLRVADIDENVKVFRSPTKDFGTWVEVHYSATPRIFIFSESKTRFYELAQKGCGVVFNTDAKPLSMTQISGDSFSDKELKSLTEKETVSLLYLWSPRKMESILAMNEVIGLSKALKLNFIPVADPLVNTTEVKAILKAKGLEYSPKKLRSLEILFRTGGASLPGIFLLGKRNISSVIPAVNHFDTRSALEKELVLLTRRNP